MQESTPYHDQLLATKFFMPASSHALISRPRLTALLDQSLHYNLTLLSAPAGFGKTTLLSEWVHTRAEEDTPVAWVSLDESDNDPVHFWTYVLTALDACQPGLCTELLAFLRAQQTPPLQSILTALINGSLERAEPLLLVLDDCHVITEQAVHDSLEYLLDHMPAHLHVFLSTRADPALSLSRLRVRDQVLEIRTNQLRCTPQEGAAFLREVMGIEIASAALQDVIARTEGWMAGLQLLGLSLRGNADPAAVLNALRGRQCYLLDYLTEEVLEQQPAAVQTFLLRTSILKRLSAPLCDAVMEQAGSQEMLEYLERANLFVVSLDEQRHWYRYHALFAQALCYRLELAGQEKLHALHLRASHWYAQQGQINEAVQHALQARAWEFAADLIEPVTQTFPWIRHELPMLWRWLEQFPSQVVRRRPRLCLAYASILHMAARTKEAEPWLEAAEAALAAARASSGALTAQAAQPTRVSMPQGHEQDKLLGEILARRALIAGYYGESKMARTLCQQALAHLAEQDLYERAIVSNAQSWIAIIEDQSVETTDRLLETSALMQAAGNNGAAINYLSVAAYFLHFQGHLHQAWRLLGRAIEFASQPGVPPSALVDLPRAHQAELLREWNQLDRALELVRQGIHLLGQVGHTLYLDEIYMVLMRIHLARGELTAATEALQRVLQIPLLQGNPFYSAWMISVDQVRLWLANGELEQAIGWTQMVEQREPLSSPFAHERQEVARVRVLLAQGRAQEALECLEPLLAHAQAVGRWYHVVEMLALQALGYQMRREEQAAISALSQAVRLAEPEGYIRRFVDEGPQIMMLLSRLREQERKRGPTRYLDTLLAAFPSEDLPQKSHPKRTNQSVRQLPPQALLDPLSERELDVMHLLARGASNQEIAEELVVAVNTVKHHVSTILSKLGVSNRAHAVAQARSLGLLFDES